MSDDRVSPEEWKKRKDAAEAARKKPLRLAGKEESGIPAEWEAPALRARALAEKGTLTQADIFELMMTCGYRPIFNEVLMRPEVFLGPELPNEVPTPMTDGLHSQLIDALRVTGAFAGKRAARILGNRHITEAALTAVIGARRYDPIVKYYTNCMAKASGETASAFDALCSHFVDEDGTFKKWLKKWMMGCIARALYGFQNYTLVLQGTQGIGKSFFPMWLCSKLGREYFQEGVALPHDKDHKLRLAMKAFWCMDEFGETFSKSSQNAIKEFLTKEDISERPPYGKYNIQLRRRCNMIATSNDSNIFCDPTGNRRYLTVKLTAITHDYAAIDVDLVWGEIFLEMAAAGIDGPEGCPWKLRDDEKELQAIRNKTAEEEDVVEMFLEATFIKRPKHKIPASEIYSRVFSRFEAHGDAREEQHLMKRAKNVLVHKWGVEAYKSNSGARFEGVDLRALHEK